MDYGLGDFLTLIGSLGLFLYGMKLMSEALQKVAGDKMRTILSAMTSNRVKGVMTGVLITALIQSSSATTVMVVSFVNAGLLSLVESVGVIMGANIGTTVTAWLISLLGFKVSMSAISLPLIGLSLPLLFSGNRSRKNWGELVIGFALLFIGLQFLKESMPDIKNNPAILNFLASYTDLGFGSYLLFAGIGTLLTILIQSSSATMALTLVMCNSGWISFDMAAAMVLGENIGTTITANLAAMVANTSAKRAARAHLIFNTFGVLWMLMILPYFLEGIAALNMWLGGGNPLETDPALAAVTIAAVPVSLSLFHTIFNVLNVLIMIWFTKLIVKIVIKLVPSNESEDEVFKLKHITTGMLSTPEASLFQAKKEISLYAKHTKMMFGYVKDAFNETNEKSFLKLYEKVDKLEDESDDMELEIANYLTTVSETRLSPNSSKRVRAFLKMVDDIESIGDSMWNITKALHRKREQKAWFPQEVRDNLNKMFELVDEALIVMFNNTEKNFEEVVTKKAYEIEKEIDEFRTILKQQHLSDVKAKKYEYKAGIIYNDIFSECEKIGDYCINISQSIHEIKD
ncbi:Na/Pi cotransporter family protein [Ancylomarina euxinus]|uniref:Na/Pi cotransporter family protein n=1 Tax=Ancylomarina euxinus TaxID=2283627 RepID=A0A425Y837_9BACT|nr:Na/Pi cotransporter family protein [Ancylomarina euxinus]MCZ4693422.1 Na/Pi cotransporter family protein [Ancylomarina euxinus]MUP13649.1 Na/Pi cotransporter family protein [Ancylomarina euxinus]RRG24709.1 Na/Pi cotransporter family protein [Ancylomarina euxinus]